MVFRAVFVAAVVMGVTESAVAKDANQLTFSPIFAYDPVYQSILGIALFSYPDQEETKLGGNVFRQGSVMGTWDGYVRLSAMENRTYLDRRQRELSVSLNNFFDYEFPEGSSQYNRYDRWQTRINSEWSLPISDSTAWSWLYGVSLEAERHDRDGNTTKGYPSVGVERDRRDRSMNTRFGDVLSSRISVLPDALHSQSIDEAGWRWQADYRHYQPILAHSVLASRLEVEASDGDVFVSSVGGSNQLRGFVEERYEGKMKVAGQLELRFPIWKWIAGATFIETGQIKTHSEWRTLSNGGVGLRFGLPPDGAVLLRFDYGIADNGDNEVFVNFNQAF